MSKQEVETQVNEIRSRMAEQPCYMCDGERVIASLPEGLDDLEACWDCRDTNGKPTGLAFPWASEVCPYLNATQHFTQGKGLTMEALKTQEMYHDKGFWPDRCNGAGRVPKAMGLEELMTEVVPGVRANTTWAFNWFNEWECTFNYHLENGVTVPITTYGETPLLAALRAVEKTVR